MIGAVGTTIAVDDILPLCARSNSFMLDVHSRGLANYVWVVHFLSIVMNVAFRWNV